MPLPPIQYLICPDCRGSLHAKAGGETLCCMKCEREFCEHRDVLDLVPSSVLSLTQSTVDQFGASWQIHDHLAAYQEKQLLDWIAPLAASDFAGKDVLEAGCGKGRHSRLLERFGPRYLFSVDLSDAVLLAAHNTKDHDNVFCLRGDLLGIPLADASMDRVLCIGVLHHLEDPQVGLKELWRVLKPGGMLGLWVYGREGNGWIVHLVDPVRRHITSRIPTRWLRPVLWPLSALLFLLLKAIYGPLTARGRRRIAFLPYSAYLGYISKFPFREIEHIVLDHLCPPIAFYLSKATLESWLGALGASSVTYRWHNRNSWTVVAHKIGVRGQASNGDK